MLLRSSSAPILTSWVSHSKDSEREPEPLLSRTRSISLSSSSFHSPTIDPTKTQVSLESDIKIQQNPRNKNLPPHTSKPPKEPEDEIKPTSRSLFKTERLLSSSGLGEKVMDGEDCGGGEKKESVLSVIILCSTDVERVVPRVKRNENSLKTCFVEQHIPPIFGVPNMGRNILSHSVPSRLTYQKDPHCDWLWWLI
ncbi:hypothetical protein D8674_022512 [Pyrus ussuriensis x Pyrus communis]|uniref:Uncharacterized protein n=1 Tax=Pyrus ussuriensis x Pyrus communis TaxID=2448454 RepID=A0A5N5GYT3_9ROSA|nr:hypothetical protein D8674_022512 [Pyrus ussuriensis x Pyrus communis]